MRPLLSLSLVAALATVASAREPEVAPVARGNQEFGLDLYAKLRAQEGNIFISPQSLSAALGMTLEGARGDTAEQMRRILRLDREALGSSESKGVELSVANAFWSQSACPFRAEFVDSLREKWRAEAQSLDFGADPEAARARINRWVEEKTREKIKDLIGPGVLSAQTRLVLTNAIHFQGRWATRFKKEETATAPFHLANGAESSVPLMHISERDSRDKVGFARTDVATAIELPYEGGELSFVAMMPNDPSRFAAFESSLTAEKVNGLIGKLARGPEVEVFLPRFEMKWSGRLERTLADMGMKDLFDESKANLSGMTAAERLYVSAVVHQTFVRVDEEGTVAAGATAVVVDKCAAAIHEPNVFRADRPFVFLIRNVKTGAAVFLGRCADPRVAS